LPGGRQAINFAFMLKIQEFVFNAFQENTYVLYDETGEAVIVDPGCYEEDEKVELEDFIKDKRLKIMMLVNTHGHIDHVLGNNFIKERYRVKLYIHKIDEPVMRAVKAYAGNYGFPMYQEASVDGYLEEGNVIAFGNQQFKILFVPGHSPGHVAFYNEKEKVVIGGDVLFKNSIGRTDLPGGNFDTLINSIHEKLFTLPDDVVVYAGHGPRTTIGWAACIFDFFDGFAARLLKVSSPIGKELDSMADMVSFGALPSLFMYKLLQFESPFEFLPYVALLIAVCSALRLAIFNIDETQSDSFRGLPTPANALFITALPFLDYPFFDVLFSPVVLTIITLIFSVLLVSRFELFALKFKNFTWTDNKVRFTFLLLSVLLLAAMQFAAIPLIILLYVAGSLGVRVFSK
jgi:hydroxyacylglutathione hydrolase